MLSAPGRRLTSRTWVLGAVIVAAAVLLFTSASALAATPTITLSSAGESPNVAVDPSSGDAYIVWIDYGTGAMDYCKVPAGGGACAVRLSFPVPFLTAGSAKVIIGSAGQVILTDEGGGTADVEAYVSSDGGNTFTAEGKEGSIGGCCSIGQAVLGPGAFTVSEIDSGGNYQAVPFTPAGPPSTSDDPPANTESAQLFPGGCQSQSVAMVNSLSPVAECTDQNDGRSVSYRVFTPSASCGDVDNASCWGATGQIADSGGSGQAAVAGGLRGVYAFYENGASEGVVSRLNTATGSFGSAAQVAKITEGGATNDLSEDSYGNLYAAYLAGPNDTQLGVSTSSDGTSWTAAKLGLTTENGTVGTVSVAGCAPGNGFLVWDESASHVYAKSLGTAPCGTSESSSTCPTSLTVGAAYLQASSGCFAAAGSGGHVRAHIAAAQDYTTSDPFEMNGITIDPRGQMNIDTVNRTLDDVHSALVTASNLALADAPIDWAVPPAGGALQGLNQGQLANLRNGGQPVAFTPSAVNGSVLTNGVVNNLLSFPIQGEVIPSLLAGGKALLPANIPLPSPVSGLLGGTQPTGLANLTSGDDIPGGLSLGQNAVTISEQDVFLGLAELKPFTISYDRGADTFDGQIGLYFPEVPNTSFNLHLEFVHGKFAEGDLLANLGDSVPIYPDVFLNTVGLHVEDRSGGCPAADWEPGDGGSNPTYFGGELGVALGPILSSLPPVLQITANASYTFPEADCGPGVFSISGDADLFGFPVANAYTNFTTGADITLGANVSIGDHALGLDVSVAGGVGIHKPYPFFASGKADVYVGGIAFGPVVEVSSIGVGACLSPLGEIEYTWASKSLSGGLLESCDLSNLTPVGLDAARAADAPLTVQVPRGQSAYGIALKAASGAPLVELKGPGGETITTPTPAAAAPAAITTTAAADIAVAPSENGTLIKLLRPRAGTWTVTPLAGSPGITSLSTARGLPPAAVRAHVRVARNGIHELDYTSTPAPGRVVTFVEEGRGVAQPIGRTTKRRGQIRFVPTAGPRGRRTILADVTANGLLLSQLKVARYTAPGPPRLRAPRHVTAKRHREQLRISWDRVRGAIRYAVRTMLKDGRANVLIVPAARHAVTIDTVPDFDRGSIMVAALNAANQPGPIGRVKLRSVKPACKSPRAVRGKLVCTAHRAKRRHHKSKG